MGKKIQSMRDHYIICGYGRIGKIICRELNLNKIPVVVIETDTEIIKELEGKGVPYVVGDATNEEVLIETRIERARGLVSVVASDADNLFITMSARVLNPGIFILARADEEHSEKKLLRAGANKVAMPYLIGGHKMAQIITKPAVTDFLDFTVQNREMDLEMEELLVDEKSALNGVALINSNIRQDTNVIIVAIRKKDGEMVFNPSSQTSIEAGDTLISLGNREDLEKLSTILAGK